MEITTEFKGESIELKLKGRLDASWCEHVSSAISSTIQDGAHRILLNMAEVNYISSAGIRVLMTYYKQLRNISGELFVVTPSAEVKAILELSGLSKLLSKASVVNEAISPHQESKSDKIVNVDSRFEAYDLGVTKPVALRLIGDISAGLKSAVSQSESASISFGDQMLGLGLGAIGDKYDDCKDRFGEFLSIAGASVFLPTGSASQPDYMITQGDLVPKMQVAYGFMGDLSFNYLLRFSSHTNDTIGLSVIADVVLKTLNVETAVIGIIAETAALVGAALRQTPSSDNAEKFFEFPEIRKRLTFTAERAHQKSVSLVLGLATRKPDVNISPLVRPLDKDETLKGHFHGAAFSYAPIKKGQIDLHQTIRGIFESQSLLGVLHLLNDTRELNGVGESEFVRGACWCAPAVLV